MSETRVLEQVAELEAIARQLTLAALKLPTGAERGNSLLVIGGYRERIAAIKQSELDRARIIQAFKTMA